MARNKYPEVTVERILDAAQKLFLEKGYDNTTIQDIVDELGGLTKGAIYHHYKSKDEIMDALTSKMFLENNPFNIVKQRKDLSGLEKMKLAMTLNISDGEQTELTVQAIPILKNPRILAGMIENNLKVLTPFWYEFLEDGIKDGSIKTEYAKEISELIPLFDLWLTPSIYPANADELYHKFLFIKTLLDSMGVPIIDEETASHVKERFSEMESKN